VPVVVKRSRKKSVTGRTELRH